MQTIIIFIIIAIILLVNFKSNLVPMLLAKFRSLSYTLNLSQKLSNLRNNDSTPY